MTIDTTFLRRRIDSLEQALREIADADDDLRVEICEAVCQDRFERALDQCGKLLRKRLASFFASNRQADRLEFRDLFRHAARHDLLRTDAVERWLGYRDNRNDTARNCGGAFTEATLNLLPTFIEDAKALADMIEGVDDG